MDDNLALTAQRWQLAPTLKCSGIIGGVMVVKNTVEGTHLAITPHQWSLLNRFTEPRMVPPVLGAIIQERVCPALGEFYELIIKAVRERILVAEDYEPISRPTLNWPIALKAHTWRVLIILMGVLGWGATVALRPALPDTWLDAGLSLAIAGLAAGLGEVVANALLRGAGGTLYLDRKFFVRRSDVVMHAAGVQRSVAGAPIAVAAATAGLVSWLHPAWALFPVVGLLVQLRPVGGGPVNRILRIGARNRLSDAEHHFTFQPNRSPSAREQSLQARFRRRTTWWEILYGVCWIALTGYTLGMLSDMPLRTLGFWETHGWSVGLGFVSIVAAVILIYAFVESYVFTLERASNAAVAFELWYRRWLAATPETFSRRECLQAVRRSPLLRQLPVAVQQTIAKRLRTVRIRPGETLTDFDEDPGHVSLIQAGKIGVYRRAPNGKPRLMQELSEEELAGLHAAADPKYPQFSYRALTPLTLLQLEWADARELLLPHLPPKSLVSLVIKTPFLARMELCRHWHFQAIRRFADYAEIVDYDPGEIILRDEFFSEFFFIVLEGSARISKRGMQVGTVRGRDFLGEIGLLQNSDTTAQVTASEPTRCLRIGRREFLRFVAHNHTVALELERVSSQRLGRPIFPLTLGDFKTL
ncbi:cyclic nucleotide-binding domain-containing protein [Synoicihabitans lomoniglobus]|uniref:Cyclic nucleotide-binding domain-containing protein n=1 Tax=Synoicihabitans lomoniglobus TaxID=2909285 RepID=A0AAE9ZXE5_9BACT|nr:cyclic nucleotide-binding domain-containing protein [Opitutaceae bacterium LMO-M01]WED64675.1 cyclic nucleotide-binding domain-containing protein [Opitutaceae bacterium LMO-M01]